MAESDKSIKHSGHRNCRDPRRLTIAFAERYSLFSVSAIMLQDYHLHTRFSCDSQASMTDMCRAACQASIPEIGFTEHFDLHPKDECRNFFRIDEWWKELEACRDTFRGKLAIRSGIELSEPHRYPGRIRDLLGSYPWDYALGSLHWVGDDLIFHHEYFKRSKQAAYENYFQEMRCMVEDGEFDILAHMDIVKRYGFEHYGPFDPREFESQIRSILHTLARRNIAIEINTITLRRSVNETSPSRQILRWFFEEGGSWVTIGSDAHTPEEVGCGLHQALRHLCELQHHYLASYHQRVAVPIAAE
jgi:histidinol-phosphatase (PHP family)